MDLKKIFLHEENAPKKVHAEQKEILEHQMVPKNNVLQQNDHPPPLSFDSSASWPIIDNYSKHYTNLQKIKSYSIIGKNLYFQATRFPPPRLLPPPPLNGPFLNYYRSWFDCSKAGWLYPVDKSQTCE